MTNHKPDKDKGLVEGIRKVVGNNVDYLYQEYPYSDDVSFMIGNLQKLAQDIAEYIRAEGYVKLVSKEENIELFDAIEFLLFDFDKCDATEQLIRMPKFQKLMLQLYSEIAQTITENFPSLVRQAGKDVKESEGT